MTIRKSLYVDSNGDYTESTGMFETSDYIDTSTGAADAGKPVVLNSNGQIDSSMISFDGLDWKQGARVATTAAIDLASAPANIDGVVMANGDRVVVKNGSTVNSGVLSVDNGIYVYNGVGVAMTRSTDADEDSEVTGNMVVSVSEGAANEDRIFRVVTNDPIVVGVTPFEFEILPVNTFSAGDGIDISNGIISVDLLDTGSGLEFAGGGSDELAINFATDFTIDAADDLAPQASDYASTTVGEGASRVGISDASGYFTGNEVETAFDELEAQIGGTTSTTFDFTENNVLADNDSVYPALNKLDLKWGDLASTNPGEGASLVGIEDAAGNFTATTVEGALAELSDEISEAGVIYEAGTGGVTIGDMVYVSANDVASTYDDITVPEVVIGIALETAAAGVDFKVLANDTVIGGILGAATPGTKYFWDGSGYVTGLGSFSAGDYIWLGGVAKNATDAHVQVTYVKRQA